MPKITILCKFILKIAISMIHQNAPLGKRFNNKIALLKKISDSTNFILKGNNYATLNYHPFKGDSGWHSTPANIKSLLLKGQSRKKKHAHIINIHYVHVHKKKTETYSECMLKYYITCISIVTIQLRALACVKWLKFIYSVHFSNIAALCEREKRKAYVPNNRLTLPMKA